MRHFELGDEVIYNHAKKVTRVVGVRSNRSGLPPLYLIENPKGFILDSVNLRSLEGAADTEYLELKKGEKYSWISHDNLELPEDSLQAVLEVIKEETKVKIDHNFQYIK